MNPLKKLAGQTAIYGLSSIVGRLLNYLLVPLHTRIFEDTAQYGIVNEMYAYVAFLIVVLTYGMETAFFRYTEKEGNKDSVYGTTLYSIIVTSILFISAAIMFAQPIADLLRYPENKEYVIWFGMIIAFDAITSIPFARLRAKNKAKKFAAIKMVNIGVNITFNLFYLWLCPLMLKHGIMTDFVDVVYKGKIGVGYIFIANLIASTVTLLLLCPEMFGIKYKFDFALWKRMIKYALPLLILGLAGIINETLDRILIKYLMPEDIAMAELGIYGACYKIAIMMTIFIQAFRYAAEPFFFSQAKEGNAKQVYADVMKYFVIIMLFIFLGIILYLDIIKYFIGSTYHSGLKVVPILLMANLFLGVFYNLSIWYKLTDKTHYGAYISIFGAVITLGLNFWLIPIIGYMGSAWATFACYFSMMAVSYFIGRKHYPINYNVKTILGYFGIVMLLFLVSSNIHVESEILSFIINTLLFLVFAGIIFYTEKVYKIIFNKPTKYQ